MENENGLEGRMFSFLSLGLVCGMEDSYKNFFYATKPSVHWLGFLIFWLGSQMRKFNP